MLNERMYHYGAERSVIREIFAYACERKAALGAERVFDFSLGNPHVPAPPAVRASIERSLATLSPAALHGYSPAGGLPEVRAAVAASLNKRYHMAYQPDDVFMTVGAAASLSCALNAVVTPAEEVIVVAPFFPEYRVWIEQAGVRMVVVPAQAEDFTLNLDALASAISPRTAAVIINSPNNPTGVVYTREQLSQLADILRAANNQRQEPIYFISDEPYRDLVSPGVEVPWLPELYEHTMVCYSYSKVLSLAGERVGWVLVPGTMPRSAEIQAAVAGAARALGFVCAPVLFQRVVMDCVDEAADMTAYERNRATLAEALRSHGYHFVEPEGAFYLWVQALESDATAFCNRARNFELLPVPSDSFGISGWVRISYCVSLDCIQASLPAWKALAESYRS
ncbi:pyridoxal phosphate-dependent aminotransferase [Collinsella sp. zg1085]|uniref:pyridoxal phosphate-dependent aminotransferase n=1 Tax=Collinsella sp. zg1085 TaxID=2844380 RepID=UPI001C0BFD23|nr:pyridoxal phosphate-dependent aminotransferase [Collinsella sp. zg1085]QWT17694.1 pyridoxal phosphate-dependent aminotransferase [Collinsella sp. zg1085]